MVHLGAPRHGAGTGSRVVAAAAEFRAPTSSAPCCSGSVVAHYIPLVRLVHLSDLHLGFRQYHRVTPLGINQREADVALAFRRAMDRVIQLGPDVVVIAGDVFHSVRPMNAAIIDAFRQFARLTQALPDAIVVMVAGNHDRPRSTETECILRLFMPLGIHVVDMESKRLSFPERSLSILAVPDLRDRLPALSSDPASRYNVLVLHGEVEGLLPAYLMRGERVAMEIPRRALTAGDWSYVALGHHHVHRQMAERAFYAGSLDYTSRNPWGDLAEERALGLPGKGFVEVDLDAGTQQFHYMPPSRPLIELDPISARGMSAGDVDAAIRQRVDSCKGGIDERIVRLLVRDVPRHVVRDLDHRALRDYRRRALHFQLDTRRPEVIRSAVSGAPGRRPTLTAMVESYLMRRPLGSGLDRAALVQLGLHYLKDASAGEQGADSGS